jgi:hypothetical protein
MLNSQINKADLASLMYPADVSYTCVISTNTQTNCLSSRFHTLAILLIQLNKVWYEQSDKNKKEDLAENRLLI